MFDPFDPLVREFDNLREQLDPDGPLTPPDGAPIPARLVANAGTCACLRGPCMWLFWSASPSTKQSGAGGRFILKQNTHCHLTGQKFDFEGAMDNMVHCSHWCPLIANWVPESIWFLIKPVVWRVWDRVLERLGYNFAWRGGMSRLQQDRPAQRAKPWIDAETRRDEFAGMYEEDQPELAPSERAILSPASPDDTVDLLAQSPTAAIKKE